MRIILATPIYPPESGGPATYVCEIAERLKSAHEITVVALAEQGATAILGTALISISKQSPLPVRLYKMTSALMRCAKDADLIYAQNAMAAGLPAVIAGWFTRKPVIIKFVGDEAWERAAQSGKTNKRLEEFYVSREGGPKIFLMRLIQGFVLRQATLVTTPSAYLRDEIVRAYRIDPKRAEVNYNAVARVSRGDTKRIPRQIAVVARLVAWKGVDGIIRAVAKLREAFADITLKIAGDGPLRSQLESQVAKLGLKTCVTFLGNIPSSDARRLYRESEVFVLNSTYEGLPHSVLESFDAQTPVVATEISGTKEAVFHEKTGLLVPLGGDEALVHAITSLFSNHTDKTFLTTNASRLLDDKFSWQSHLSRLNEFFLRVTRA